MEIIIPVSICLILLSIVACNIYHDYKHTSKWEQIRRRAERISKRK